MPRRTGSADLPLHGGHVPSWLAARMSRLGAVITEAIVHHYGTKFCADWLTHSGFNLFWRRHGHGLAFLGDHHERDWCAEAGTGSH